jgi:(p)ppGpp synthase/HD superfamily hydrolase
MLMSLKARHIYAHLEKNTENMKVLMLAKTLHGDQKDASGIDYIVHLIHSADIALSFREKLPPDEKDKIQDNLLVKLMLLHDSLEDDEPRESAKRFNKTVEDLFHDYSIEEDVIKSIKMMSKKEDETYKNFINRIKDSEDGYAILGKISDLASNMHPLRKHKNSKSSLEKRYESAIKTLGGESLVPYHKKENKCSPSI